LDIGVRVINLQAGQPHLHSGKSDGAAYPRGGQQASGGKEGYQE